MASVMPEGTPCVPVKEAPENLADYDTVFVGFWVDRGTANKEAAKLIETLKNPNIVFFATLGMYADSERDALHKAAETHPDEQDFANAKEFTKSVLAKLQA